MAKKMLDWQKLLVVVVVLAFGYMYFMAPATPAAVTDTGAVEPSVTGYTPWALTHVYMYVWNDADKDSTFGADDAKCRVWNAGEVDYIGPYIDEDSNAATTGQIDFDAGKLLTGTSYDVVCYEGDGGTSLYATDKIRINIPQIRGDATSANWVYPENIYMNKEGTITAVAWDSATDAFDESSGAITLNKTAQTIEGCLKWDGTISVGTAGSILKDPVLLIREDPSSPLTDSDDVEHVYVSVKTGSGVEVPAGDLIDYFTGEIPIPLTNDGIMDDSTSATITATVCFPASESDLGTGAIQFIVDDMGDYRGKDFDRDVRATADTTTLTITA